MGRYVLTGLRALAGDSTGATAVEYAIILAAIAAVIVLVVTALGLSVRDLSDSVPAF